jgi:hypothetical protein
MKVETCKSVDLDLVVDVDIDDFVAEFAERLGSADEERWRWMLESLDAMTRILAGVKSEAIQAVPDRAREIIAGRLAEQSKRWAPR